MAMNELVNSDYRDIPATELLRMRPSVLLGIGEGGDKILDALEIRSIFDLATSSVFHAAVQIVTAADSTHPYSQHGQVPADLVTERGEGMTPAELMLGPPVLLTGIRPRVATDMSAAFDIHTVADLAAWAPYHAARAIIGVSLLPDPDQADQEAPPDLIPRNGDFPTERMTYSHVFLRELEGETPPHDVTGGRPLDVTDLDNLEPWGFGYGAVIDYEQSWFNQGVALGSLLHSLALAPGESTNIAVIDWHQRTTASADESIDESEFLSNQMLQSRSISEVAAGVVNEVQEGFAEHTQTATTSGASIGMGSALRASASAEVPVEGIPVELSGGFGSTSGVAAGTSTTSGHALTVTRTSGSRSTFAEYAQNIEAATQQVASSVRSRRASIVQETERTETEAVTTRNVTNYNHMHALSVCYYEIVQIYRVVLRPKKSQKCLFIPVASIDFTDDDVVDRFRATLIAFALDSIVPRVLMSRREILILAGDENAVFKKVRSPLLSPPPGPFGGPSEPIEDVLPGPIEVPLSSRLKSIKASSGSTALGVTVKFTDGTSLGLATDALDRQVKDVSSITIEGGLTGLQNVRVEMVIETAAPPPSDGDTFMVDLGDQTFVVEFSADLSSDDESVDLLIFADDVTEIDFARLESHLIANRMYYSRRIWENMDEGTMSLLLSQYHLDGIPLVQRVDPRPVGITGAHVCFRMHLDDAEQQAWEQEMAEWGLDGPGASRTDTVPLPSGGLFAEAVLGRFNSAEKLDMTRFWNWQDSPIPHAAPEIAPIETGKQSSPSPVLPGMLGTPVLNIQNPPALPDPTGIGALMGLLGTSNIFRDMSFGEETIDAASNAVAATLAHQAVLADVVKQAMVSASNLAGNISEQGAKLNAGLLHAPKPNGNDDNGNNGEHGNGSNGNGGNGNGGNGNGGNGNGGNGNGGNGNGGNGNGGNGNGGNGNGGNGDGGPDLLMVSLEIGVPYSCVRIDPFGFLDALTPPPLDDAFAELSSFARWMAGLEEDSDDEAAGQGLAISSLASAIGFLVVGVGSRLHPALALLLGFMSLTPGEVSAGGPGLQTVADSFDRVLRLQRKMMELLLGLVFPSINVEIVPDDLGDDRTAGQWALGRLNLVLDPDRDNPVRDYDAPVLRFVPLNYGFSAFGRPIDDAPWWSCVSDDVFWFENPGTEAGEFQMSATANWTSDRSGIEVAISGTRPVLLNYEALLARMRNRLMLELIQEFDDFVQWAEDSMPVLEQFILDKAAAWTEDGSYFDTVFEYLVDWVVPDDFDFTQSVLDGFEWVIRELAERLAELGRPDLHFDFGVTLTNAEGTWSSHATGYHSNFPYFEVSTSTLSGANVHQLYLHAPPPQQGPAGLYLTHTGTTQTSNILVQD